jgi:hypothetical protein
MCSIETASSMTFKFRAWVKHMMPFPNTSDSSADDELCCRFMPFDGGDLDYNANNHYRAA